MNAVPSKIQNIDLTMAYALAGLLDCLDGKPADVKPEQALSAVPSGPTPEVSLALMRQAKEVLGRAMRRQ